MNERKEVLKRLIAYEDNLALIMQDLQSFEWDSDKDLVRLNRQDISAVLARYLSGELYSSHVEDWANALEGREDVGYEAGKRNLIKDTIFDLANPDLSEPLSELFAQKIIKKLAR